MKQRNPILSCIILFCMATSCSSNQNVYAIKEETMLKPNEIILETSETEVASSLNNETTETETIDELPTISKEDWMLEESYYVYSSKSSHSTFSAGFMFAIRRDDKELTGYVWLKSMTWDILEMEDALLIKGTYEDGYAYFQVMDESNHVYFTITSSIDRNGRAIEYYQAKLRSEDGETSSIIMNCKYIDKRSEFDTYLSESSMLCSIDSDISTTILSLIRRLDDFYIIPYLEYPIMVQDENEIRELKDLDDVHDYLYIMGRDILEEYPMDGKSIIIEKDGQCWMQFGEYRIEFGKTDAGNYVIRSIIRTVNE